jgi:DNA-binding NtrC family response regulator
MMSEQIKILCVDHKSEILENLETVIQRSGEYKVLLAKSWVEGLEFLENDRRIQVVVAGNRIAAGDGIAFLCQVGEKHPNVVRLILADASTDVAIVEAIQADAVDQSISFPWDNNVMQQQLPA